MLVVSKLMDRLRLIRKAAILAVIVPASLLGACASQPPPPAPVQVSPPPPPAPVPRVRG
jgi:hypothetical protein